MFAFLLVLPLVAAHQYQLHAPVQVADVESEEWYQKYGDQHDLPYTGPLSYMHLPYAKCLEDASHAFDIAILGFPFDTTTSYRPGARLGPQAIRMGSSSERGYTLSWGSDPFEYGARIMDCGDVPLTPMDNAKAIDQMEVAYSTLLARPVQGETKSSTAVMAKDGKEHPRLVTLGGDHTIVLPILRSLYKVYGSISVIHFDAHFDTASVEGRTGQDRISHGSYFTIAAEERLMTNTSIHGGIRQKMGQGRTMVEHDESVGFAVISTEDIDDYGIQNVIKKIRDRVGMGPVYLSLDIDVIDPGMAPATGTPEAGGWTTREVKRIIRGLAGLNFVGCDIVEVAPAYDQAEITSRAAAGIVADFLSMLQADAPPKPHVGPFLDD
ncbi:arginase deacetylase [Mycena sanguinolenta]|nr:arginase deacetylase [Mycena sanguinolenta]